MKAPLIRCALILLAAPLCTRLPAATPEAPAKDIPQWHGQYGGFPDLTTTVLRTSAAWDSFWKRVDKPAPRALDEKKEMAVVVYAGERPTGGFIVHLLDYAVSGDALVVTYQVEAPGPDKFTTQAFTAPWGVAVLPRDEHEVIFKNAAR